MIGGATNLANWKKIKTDLAAVKQKLLWLFDAFCSQEKVTFVKNKINGVLNFHFLHVKRNFFCLYLEQSIFACMHAILHNLFIPFLSAILSYTFHSPFFVISYYGLEIFLVIYILIAVLIELFHDILLVSGPHMHTD